MFDFARRWLAIVQAQLQNLDRSQKLLIGSLSIIIVMALFLVMQYAASPELRELITLPTDTEERTQIISYLDTNNVDYRLNGNMVMVKEEDRHELMAQLAVNNLLPEGEETSRAFEKMIENHQWYLNNSQNKALYIVALQNELSATIGHMSGVKRASVVVADPEFRRIGQPRTRPSASVTIFMEDGRKMNNKLAMSIAGLVAGAKAGMGLRDVKVVDALTGKLFDPSRDDMIAGDVAEKRIALQQQYREMIEDLIKVPNSVVAVNISLAMGKQVVADYDIDPDQAASVLTSKRTEDFTSNSQQPRGVAGARSNVTDSILPDGNGQTNTERSTTDEQFMADIDKVRRDVHLPAGAERQVNVSLNLPYTYLVGVHKLKTGSTTEPNEEELIPTREAEMARIQASIDNLLKESSNDPNRKAYDIIRAGSVSVSYWYDIPLGTGGEEEVATAGAYPNIMGIPMPGSAWLIILSVVSVGMMLFMVFRASKRPKMASIHELAGIPESPPTMPEADEMVGELGETGGVLEGLELDDEDLRREKILNQVRDLINDHPEEAAMLVTRWASQGG